MANRKLFVVAFFAFWGCAAALPKPKTLGETVSERVKRVLSENPVIDGHNDFPMGVRDLLRNDVSKLNFDHDLTQEEPWASYRLNHVDLPRMRRGQMGGQFWAAFISCRSQFQDAVQLFLEQVDVIRQMVDKYPDDLMWAVSSSDLETAISTGKIGSLVGVESGYAIGNSLAILRTLYDMGARYMTLTHVCNTPWVDAAQVDSGDFPPRVNGLSEFGVHVVREMNRLGFLVDLSHVSADAMRQSIEASLAPVMFSHSGARSICSNPRNVPDDVLEMVKAKGGIVMVNFYPCFLIENCRTENATVKDIVKHINHIRKIAGVDHIGLGSDFSGIDITPADVPDVSGYPKIFEALIEDGTYEWTDEDLAKVASRNLINVFRQVEEVRDNLAAQGVKPDNTWIQAEDLGDDTGCMSEL